MTSKRHVRRAGAASAAVLAGACLFGVLGAGPATAGTPAALSAGTPAVLSAGTPAASAAGGCILGRLLCDLLGLGRPADGGDGGSGSATTPPPASSGGGQAPPKSGGGGASGGGTSGKTAKGPQRHRSPARAQGGGSAVPVRAPSGQVSVPTLPVGSSRAPYATQPPTVLPDLTSKAPQVVPESVSVPVRTRLAAADGPVGGVASPVLVAGASGLAGAVAAFNVSAAGRRLRRVRRH